MKDKYFNFLAQCIWSAILIISYSSFSQETSLDVEIKKIEKLLYAYQPNIVITKVDSIFEFTKITKKNPYYFILKESKSQALIQAELYDEAFIIIKHTLYEKNIPIKSKVKLLNQLALVYELLQNFEKCKTVLQESEGYFESNKIKKNEEYGVLLYRKSSFYRVQNIDSLALKYAKQANAFGRAKNYKSVEAVSNMLLALLSKPNEDNQRIYFLKEALKYWKQEGDMHGVSNIYISIGKFYNSKKQPLLNLIYCDSALQVAKKTHFFNTISYAYLSKSEAFEQLNNIDSALHYYKKYNEQDEIKKNITKELKIKELDNNFVIKTENLKRDFVVKENETFKDNNFNLTILLLILALFFITLTFLFYKLQKQKNLLKKQTYNIEKTNISLTQNFKEKELLLKELHHRVKNNLSLITSLVNFQLNSTNDQSTKDKFTDLKNRITAISIAHERLFIDEINGLSESYNLNEFINAISNAQLELVTKKVAFNSKIKNIFIPVNSAIPLGILINELLSNSIKHAVYTGETLKIDITIFKINSEIIIEYFDNGNEFIIKENPNSLGLFIIENMIRQIGGTFTRTNSKYSIKIKSNSHE